MTEHEDRRGTPRREQDMHNDLLAQHLAALAALVEATATNVGNLTTEVGKLREVIVPRKAIEGEARRIARDRRRGLVGLGLFATALAWAGDEHIEHCGPGVRAETAVRVLVDADPADPDVRDDIVRAVSGSEQPKFCDVSFPLHDHDGNGWPHEYNILGIALWGTGVAGAVFYTRDSWRQRRRLSDE